MIIRFQKIMKDSKAESGLSLVELLVTMMLLSLVLIMSTSLYISVVQTTDNAQVTNEGTRVAANAMNEINRVVRFAVESPVSSAPPLPAFSVAKANEMVIFSLVDVDGTVKPGDRPIKPVMVKFALEADGNIVERRWNPTPSGQFWNFGTIPPANNNAVRSRVLGGKFLATGTNSSLFRYLKADGTEMIPTAAGLNPAQRASIASVVVTMNAVPLVGPDDKPVIITNTIGMLNLGPNIREE